MMSDENKVISLKTHSSKQHLKDLPLQKVKREIDFSRRMIRALKISLEASSGPLISLTKSEKKLQWMWLLEKSGPLISLYKK